MSLSLGGISSLVDTTKSNTMVDNRVTSLQSSLNGVSSSSKEEELMQVCKDFGSYFVEEMLKEVKENLMENEDKDKDSSLSTLTDFHMDGTIEMLADQMLEQVGGGFTQQLYEQMKRNYNI